MIPGIVANIRMQQSNTREYNNYKGLTKTNKSNKQIRTNPTRGNNLNNNYNNHSNKETELSTKVSTRENLLDYTFVSHRSQLSNITKDGSKSKEYIFDLMNTWELNIDLIENFIMERNNSAELLQIIRNIKKKMELKKEMRNEAIKIKSRILIENQIMEELKRKNEENLEYYQDQLKEYEENRDGKEEYIMIFEKKLKEVEVYVQKNSKEENTKFEIHKDFKMSLFLEENLNLIKKRDYVTKELIEARNQRDEMMKENENYRQDVNNFSFTGEESYVISLSDKKDKLNEKSRLKLRQYYENCINKVRVIELRNKMLKNYFNEMTSKLKYFNVSEIKKSLIETKKDVRKIIDEELKEEGENNKIDLNVNDRSNINLDVTRKIATFMDFSVILNKKQCDETNIDFGLNKTGLGNFGNDNWDLSCIGKN